MHRSIDGGCHDDAYLAVIFPRDRPRHYGDASVRIIDIGESFREKWTRRPLSGRGGKQGSAPVLRQQL